MKGATLTFVRPIPMPASTSPSARKGFDYASLDIETAQFVQQQTGEIRILIKRTAQDIVEIGQKLIEVKKRLGHGYFLGWLSAEFGWSYPTAARFMQVSNSFGTSYQIDKFAASALYELAAPSTPEAARSEALARAETGESITYTAAKAIKQKYATPPTKPQPQPEQQPESVLLPQPSPPPTPAPPRQFHSKLEIVAIRPPNQDPALSEAAKVMLHQTAAAPQAPQPPASAPDVPGVWWRLGRHLLYCGNPNSPEFLERVAQEVQLVQLLLAFPSTPGWQPAIQARARVIIENYLFQGKNLEQLDEILELNILFCSRLSDLVISCFIPTPEILSIINRADRRGFFAEPDERCCKALITSWRAAGLKAERVS